MYLADIIHVQADTQYLYKINFHIHPKKFYLKNLRNQYPDVGKETDWNKYKILILAYVGNIELSTTNTGNYRHDSIQSKILDNKS